MLRINILFLLSVAVDGIFFGGGGGGCNCGCAPAPACPPPPVCAPSCATAAGGGYVQPSLQPSFSSSYKTAPVAAGGAYAVGPAPVAAGGAYAVGPAPLLSPLPQPAAPIAVAPSYSAVPSSTATRLDGYISPTARGVTKTAPPPKDTDKDFYDEAVPSLHKFADVSAESKELLPYDIYKRRFKALKNLRHRRLRQFSAPNVPKEFALSSACNSEKLARIMAKSMVTDISVSKRLVRKATELAFNGLKFDVICAVGDFSYSIYAEQYCETTRGNVTCFAFI